MQNKEGRRRGYLLGILLLLLVGRAFGQNIAAKTFYLIDEATQQMVPDQEFRWRYDAAGRDTLNEGWLWEAKRQTFVLRFRVQTRYDADGQMVAQHSRFWEDNGLRETLEYWTYDAAGRNVSYEQQQKNAGSETFVLRNRREEDYDANGCLLAQRYFAGPAVWTPTQRNLYYRDSDCRLDSSLSERYVAGQWQADKRSRFTYQDSIHYERQESWQNTQWQNVLLIRRTHDQHEQLLELLTEYPDSSLYRIQYDYDAAGRTLYLSESQWAAGDSIWYFFYVQRQSWNNRGQLLTQRFESDFERESQRFLVLTLRERYYDADGRVEEEQLRQEDERSGQLLVTEVIFPFKYDTYCDGQLWREDTYRERDAERAWISRVEYAYAQTAQCAEKMLPLNIAPNPARETLSFNSGLLRGESVAVRIYDLHQRLLLEATVDYRATHYILPVESLLPGYYILEVGSTAGLMREKFLKVSW